MTTVCSGDEATVSANGEASRPQRRWGRFKQVINLAFWGSGLTLSLVLAAAAFGHSYGSSQHYSNFILAVVVMSGLLALRKLAHQRIEGQAMRWFWAQFALTVAALLAAAFSLGYISFHSTRLEMSQPFFEGFDLAVGFIMIFSVIVLNWIHWGWLLSSIIIASILYFFFGHNVDSILFTHPEYATNFVLNYMGLGTTQGFFWLAQLAADSIYFLVIYAAVLLGVGTVDMVLEAGKIGGRRIRGGAAFASIFGSGIVGSVMGQAVSNVVLTGRMTIPMMKRYGYQPSMAAAIEASASTAGQILPPILGLAGFLIASLLNRPYIEVAMAALIPGLLYLTGNIIGVVVYAYRRQLPKLNESVDMGSIRRLSPTFLVSFGLVVWLLLGYRSPAYAGLIGIAAALVMCLFQGRYRPTWRAMGAALDEGLVLVTVLSLLLIAIGALGQTVMTTNLSGRFGMVLIEILPDSKLLLLIGAMIVSLALGMGLPTPVAYMVASLAMVPFLQQVGVPPLQAHFFVFYFAVFSTLTPPIAVSILAGAMLADARFRDTAAHAMKLSLTTFIVPFAFVYSPELMAFPSLGWDVLWAVIEVLIVQLAVSACAYGYLFRNLAAWERAAFGIVGVLAFMAMTQDPVIWSRLAYGTGAVLLLWLSLPRLRLAAS
jgi:TRAP transporter 4TM/12TM fusion protein